MKSRNLVIILLGLLTAMNVAAFDRPGEFGIGYGRSAAMGYTSMEEIAILTVDALTGRWWFSDTSGVDFFFGFTFMEDVDGYIIGGRYLHNIISKKYSSLYAEGGLIMDRISSEDESYDWLTIEGGIGVEFCFPGLEEIAFYGEVGIDYVNGEDYDVFGTVGDAFGSFGFHYYLR